MWGFKGGGNFVFSSLTGCVSCGFMNFACDVDVCGSSDRDITVCGQDFEFLIN